MVGTCFQETVIFTLRPWWFTPPLGEISPVRSTGTPNKPCTSTCTVTPKAVCTSVVSFREVSNFFTPPARTSYSSKRCFVGQTMAGFEERNRALGVDFTRSAQEVPTSYCQNSCWFMFFLEQLSINNPTQQMIFLPLVWKLGLWLSGVSKMWLHHKDWTSYVPNDSVP